MAAQPEQHVGLKGGGDARIGEQIRPAAIAVQRFPAGADRRVQPAFCIESRHHEGHAEGCAVLAEGVTQPLGIERVEHEVDAAGFAAL